MAINNTGGGGRGRSIADYNALCGEFLNGALTTTSFRLQLSALILESRNDELLVWVARKLEED